MADVHLRRENPNTPPVCIRCGQAATHSIQQSFSASPWWVFFFVCMGLLPYFVAEVICYYVWRITVAVPVCDNHLNHFFNKRLGYYIGWLLLVAAPVTWFLFTPAAANQPDFERGGVKNFQPMFGRNIEAEREKFTLASLAFGAAGIGLLVFFSYWGIKAFDPTDEGMMVCNVSWKFAKLYEASVLKSDEPSPPQRERRTNDAEKDHPHGITEAD